VISVELEQVLVFHNKIIKATGGSSGIRDNSLIESALLKAFATFDNQELYPGTLRKIAVITYSLINNHGFVDGNKRIGVAVMLLLLKLNGVTVNYTQEELVELGLKTADDKMTDKDIEQWIKGHRV
jgi:death-on-curing protein